MTSQRSSRLRRTSVRAASSSSSLCPSPLRSVSEAVLRSALGAALLSPALLPMLPGQAFAQSVGESRSYSIPAGSLDKALTAFAASSGVMLSFEPSQVQGLQSGGLQGEHTVWGGFSLLLQGSGLEAQSRGPGSYVLRKAGAAQGSATEGAAGALPGVTVRSRRSAETEGTGSYTSIAPLTSATKLGMTLRETPQSVTVITKQRMEDQGITQMDDIFRQTTGLTFVQVGSQGTDNNAVYSRGFEVDNYQIDGVPQLSNWLTQTADMIAYDRVEVIRGANGLTNGVGSPAATINLVRKRPFADFQASVTGTVGSWDKRRVEADISSPFNDSGSVRGRVAVALQENESWVDRLKEEKRLFYGIVEADLGRNTKLSGGLEYQQHDADEGARSGLPLFFSDGTPTHFSRSASSATNWAYSHQTQKQFFVSLDHQFDSGWAVRANFNQSRREYDDVIGYAIYQTPDRVTGAGLGVYGNKWNSAPTQRALDLYASGPFELFGRKHELVAGYNVSRTTYDAPGYGSWRVLANAVPNVFDWDGSTAAIAPFVASSMTHFSERQAGWYSTVRLKPADGLAVILGARITDWERSTRDKNYDGSASTPISQSEKGKLVPYAGLVVDVMPQWSVYGSYTGIFKPQDNMVSETEYLDPLKGKAYEVGTKASFFKERLNVSLAVFEIRQDNFAVENPTAPPLENGNQPYMAVPGTVTRGYEAEVSGELARGWQLSAGYTFSKSRDREGDALVTNVPQQQFKLFSSYRLFQVGRGLTLGGGVVYMGDAYTDRVGPSRNQRFTQPAYAVVDLMARYPFSDKLSASVNLGNAFNKTYYTSTSSTYYGAPRNVNLTVKYQF